MSRDSEDKHLSKGAGKKLRGYEDENKWDERLKACQAKEAKRMRT